MLRLAAIAMLAAAVAAPASAESIRVATAGRSAEQVHADIYKAASKLCSAAVFAGELPAYQRGACVEGAVVDALARNAAAPVQNVAAR